MDRPGSSRKTAEDDAAPAAAPGPSPTPADAPPARAMGVIEIKPPNPRVRTHEPAGEPADEQAGPLADAPGDLPAVLEAALASVHAIAGRAIAGARWVTASRVRMLWAAAMVAVGVLSAALVAMSLARSEPSWWSTAPVRTAPMADLARRVENGAITHITADHQDGSAEAVEWPVRLSDDDANAWLNLRLPVWLPRMTAEEFEDVVDGRGVVIERRPIGGVRWPESVDEVRVAFVNGRFRIGARIDTGEGTRVFGATLAPEVREDGSLWMRATTVSVGRLSLPAGLVLGGDGGALREHLPASLVDSAEGEAIFSKLAGQSPMFEDAVIRLGDGRRVRLLSLEVASDSLVAWFRTE